MSFFRFIFRLILLLLSIIIVLPLIVIMILVFQKTNQRNGVKNAIKLWSNLVCLVCGLRLEIKGKLLDNPVFIVANHVSWLDVPVIHSFKLVGFVAKAEIASWPFLGWAVKSGETVFIKRGQIESRKQVLKSLEQRLLDDRSVAVFPEGRATNGKELGRFHRQLMQAAIETNTPIQTLTIKYINQDGTRNKKICFKDKENFVTNVMRILALKPCRVLIECGEPIETNNKTARQVCEESHLQVYKKLHENKYM